MATRGQTQAVTTKDKDFNAPGIQGQKGQDAEQVNGTPPDDPPEGDATPSADPPSAETVTAPSVQTQPAQQVVRGEDVIKILRDKGHRV